MLEIELDSRELKSGDTLRGRVVLSFDGPVEAEGLVLTLDASTTIHRPLSNEPATRFVQYEDSVELSDGGTFERDRFDFELTVPSESEVRDVAKPPGLVGGLLRLMQPYHFQPMEWWLEARLKRRVAKDIVAGLVVPSITLVARRRAV